MHKDVSSMSQKAKTTTSRNKNLKMLTAVKFIGSLGFQQMEFVFVCHKKGNHKNTRNIIKDRFRKEGTPLTNRHYHTCIIIFLTGDDMRKSYNVMLRSLQDKTKNNIEG